MSTPRTCPPFTFFFLHVCTAWPVGGHRACPQQQPLAFCGRRELRERCGLVLGFAWSPRTAVWFMTVELVYRAMAGIAGFGVLLGATWLLKPRAGAQPVAVETA